MTAAAGERGRRLSWILLTLLSLLPLAVLLDPAWPGAPPAPGEDRSRYLDKSEALVRTGDFPRPTEEDLAVLRGEAPGLSDFRAPGYPVVMAALGATREDWAAARRRLALLQWAAMFACVAWVHGRALEVLPPRWWWAASAILGLQPWTAEWALERVPDTLNAALVFAGALLLAKCAAAPPSPRRTGLAAAAAAALGAATLMRPEMLLFSPLLLGAGLLLAARRDGVRALLAPAAAGAAVLLLAVGAQAAYRWTVFGEASLVGRFQPEGPGMARWLKTWRSSEEHLRTLWWPLAAGTAVPLDRFPERAFGSPGEREAVRRVVAEVAATGAYGPAQDAVFERLAAERSSGVGGLLRVAGVRAWRTGALLLDRGRHRTTDVGNLLPDRVRTLLGSLLRVLKVLVVAAAAVAFARALRRPPGPGAGPAEALLLLGAVFCIARLGWFGPWMGIAETRYMLPLWPFLLLGAFAFAGQSPRSRSEGTRDRGVGSAA
ncbi:MAG: hypothetical protein L6R43_00755 [Planctomycetes bacterium]|nr:hypothetical protein [Planctomycetota bacterium]